MNHKAKQIRNQVTSRLHIFVCLIISVLMLASVQSISAQTPQTITVKGTVYDEKLLSKGF